MKLAADHKNTVMAGRTHGQQALPITFGFKAAYWASEIRREIERMEEVYARDFVGELSGAVGTCAGFGKDGHVISEEAIARLGLECIRILCGILPEIDLLLLLILLVWSLSPWLILPMNALQI